MTPPPLDGAFLGFWAVEPDAEFKSSRMLTSYRLGRVKSAVPRPGDVALITIPPAPAVVD